MVVVAVQEMLTFLCAMSALLSTEAFIFETEYCTRYKEYADLINLAHVENCLSVDQVFSKLKSLGDQNQNCLNHVLNQLGDRYGVSVSIPLDCQCNGSNTLLTYEYGVIQGTSDFRRQCMGNDQHYKSLFEKFFTDNGNIAPACRSHHSDAFDHHHSPCSCQQSLQYGNPNNCSQFHSYQALLRLKDTKLCTSKNSLHFQNPLAVDPCTCHPVAEISNEEPYLDEGKRVECSAVRDSSYSDLRQSSFLGASQTGCSTHYRLWKNLQDIHNYNGYDCTTDFILRAANKYPSSAKDPCQCSGSLQTTTTSHAPTTTTPKYSSLSTIKATTHVLTTTTAHRKFQCRKNDLVTDIATASHVHTNGSTSCGSKVSGTNEDLVLALCNMTSIDTWSRGAQYTELFPVSTFGATERYQPQDAQSGIFLECIENGFKMAIQPCIGGPQIIHVETSGLFLNNASNYFTVV